MLSQKTTEALADFEMAVSLKPKTYMAYIQNALIHLQIGEVVKGLDMFANLTSEFDNNPDVFNIYAQVDRLRPCNLKSLTILSRFCSMLRSLSRRRPFWTRRCSSTPSTLERTCSSPFFRLWLDYFRTSASQLYSYHSPLEARYSECHFHYPKGRRD